MRTEIHIDKKSNDVQLKNDIIKTMLYFDVFDYPLTKDELFNHHGKELTQESFLLTLEELVLEKRIVLHGIYFLSPFAKTNCIERREKGNRMANAIMPEAIAWSKKINRFPFVRSVNLSGSISKNYYDENSDIDYFIITKKNRLWICRTFLILYWKLLSPKNKKKLCTNYFVDETVLELGEKNQFTAIELSYLIPIINGTASEQLLSANSWLKKHVGNMHLNRQYETHAKSGIIKIILERLFDTKLGNFIDNLLLKETIKRWRRKFPELAEEDFELQFKSRKNVCKRHTRGFQNKVLFLWSEKIAQYEKKIEVTLDER